jgi:hypothetical protein
MWIRDFWNRVLAKFKKEDSASAPVMELKAEKAPEPVPERKTSDEMIIEMAQSAAEPVPPEDREAAEVPKAEPEDRAAAEEPETEAEPEKEAEPEEEAEEKERYVFEGE